MANTKSRFNITKKLKPKNEYVFYTENLNISFKTKNKEEGKIKHVLKDVTLGVRKNETVALIGANGAGKTVLMETIIGINDIDSGELYLNLGESTYRKNLKYVGMQFQHAKFSNNVKTKKVIKQYKKLYKDRVDEEQLQEMIKIFGVEEILESKVDKVSGGQKQRLNLLLALMHNPKLMILDEFITGLDVKTVRKIITYVNDLKIKNDATMILISHQPEEVEELSDRIIVMNDGAITKETNVKEILKEYDDVALFIEEVI